MSVPDDFHGEAYRIYVRYVNRRPSEPQGRVDPNAPSDPDEDEDGQGIGCPYGDTGPS